MEDRDDDRLIGRFLFKEYRLKKKLGEGSFGKVYIASNIKTSELYAIKLVSKILFLILTFLKKNRRKRLSKIVF
jgi:serine/threonine protein kinase